LPNATNGVAYTQTLTAAGTGTVAPFTFSVAAGTLPTGLTLTPAGVLSATATVNGTFNFTIKATDSSPGTGPYSGTQSYSLVVNVIPVQFLSPITANPNPTTIGTPVTFNAS